MSTMPLTRPSQSQGGTQTTDRESRSYPSRSTSPGYTLGSKSVENFTFDAANRPPNSAYSIARSARKDGFSDAETVSIDSAGIAQFEKLMNRAAAYGNRVQPFGEKSRASVSSGIGGPHRVTSSSRHEGRHTPYDAVSRASTVTEYDLKGQHIAAARSHSAATNPIQQTMNAFQPESKLESTAPPTPTNVPNAPNVPFSQEPPNANHNSWSNSQRYQIVSSVNEATSPKQMASVMSSLYGNRSHSSIEAENEWLRQRLRSITDSYESALDQRELELQKAQSEIKKLKKRIARECPAINGISMAHLKHSNERLSAQLARLEISASPTAAAAALALAVQGPKDDISNQQQQMRKVQLNEPQQELVTKADAAHNLDEEENSAQKVKECEAAIGSLMTEIESLDLRLREQIRRSDDDRTQLQRRLEQQQSQFNVERLECDRVVHALSAKLEELAKENSALRKRMTEGSKKLDV